MRDALTRRAVGKALIALPLATLPTLAVAGTGDDPIYAAMQEHWAAWEILSASCEREPEADAPAGDEAAWNTEQDTATDALFDAEWAILDVEPTTIAGVLAFLEYVTEFSANGYRGWSQRMPEEGERGRITFEDDAMRFASRSLKRLLA